MEFVEFEMLKIRMYALRDGSSKLLKEADNYMQKGLIEMRIKGIEDCIQMVTDHQNKIIEQKRLIEQQQLIGATK